MKPSARIGQRLALAIGLTALIPTLAAIWLGQAMVAQAADRFYRPEFGARLDQSLGVYQDLARAVKSKMRAEARATAHDPRLVAALREGDRGHLEALLEQLIAEQRDIVSLRLTDVVSGLEVSADRGRPIDPSQENQLVVTAGASPWGPSATEPVELTAVFAAGRARFDELQAMSRFVDAYRMLEQRREADQRSYVYAFALLLGITIVGAVAVGVLLARGVSNRVSELASSISEVGAGDLSIRVPERGRDEIAQLARAFNSMLQELDASRARIEYLQRIEAWQEMARRLAHEIKNPLTPIQLAVQELYTRYEGTDSGYRKLVEATREIVEDEVQTLRRLVTEFSDFARLPQAELESADLVEYLREQQERFRLLGESSGGDPSSPGVDISLVLPRGKAMANIDRQMLRRALINLVRNAVEAVTESRSRPLRVAVNLSRRGQWWHLDIEDDGPGIPEEKREQVFDPYYTTRNVGTGLGLAIVKKIVVEHGGSIRAGASGWGGAAMRLLLPVAGTPAGEAALLVKEGAAARSQPRASKRAEPTRAVAGDP